MEIVTVVDFLCRGEANIIQENLDSFFAVAQELQLEGLVGQADGKKSGVRSSALNRGKAISKFRDLICQRKSRLIAQANSFKMWKTSPKKKKQFQKISFVLISR